MKGAEHRRTNLPACHEGIIAVEGGVANQALVQNNTKGPPINLRSQRVKPGYEKWPELDQLLTALP